MNVGVQSTVGFTSKASMGMPLTLLLSFSIVACAMCFFVLGFGLLPPRSPLVSLFGAIGLIGSFVAVLAVAVAVLRLSQYEALRTAQNIGLTSAAAVPVIAFLWIYLRISDYF